MHPGLLATPEAGREASNRFCLSELSEHEKYAHLSTLQEWTQRHVEYSESDYLARCLPDEQRHWKLLQ
jgi:hypothetical protein